MDSSLSIHRFLRHYLRVKLEGSSPDDCKQAFNHAFLLVRAMVPSQSATSSPTNHHWPIHERFLPHVLSLHAVFKEWDDKMPNLLQHPLAFAELLSDVGNYMYERYLIKDALTVLETAERICIKFLGVDCTDLLYIQILYLQASIGLNHGSTMRADSVKKKEHIVKLRMDRLPSSYKRKKDPRNKEHRLEAIRLSTALNNLACAYMHSEDYKRAKPLFIKSLAIKKKWVDKEYPHLPGLSEIDKNLALVSLAEGKPEEALTLAEESVQKIDRWPNGGPNTKVGQFYRFMAACVVFNSGLVDKALDDSKKILEAREKYLGIAHDHTLDSYYAVGMMYYTVGELAEAE
jgi:tetratricopeptide (TPR) repeat protein